MASLKRWSSPNNESVSPKRPHGWVGVMHSRLSTIVMAGLSAPKKDTEYIEALYQKRIDIIRKLKVGLAEPKSIIHQTVAAYSWVLDGGALAETLCASQGDRHLP